MSDATASACVGLQRRHVFQGRWVFRYSIDRIGAASGPIYSVRSEWHWVTPGAALGVTIWLAASLGFRAYLHFFNSYSATYGSLGAVVILLWLYITSFAILIGAELNWIIEAADKGQLQQSETTKVQRRAA